MHTGPAIVGNIGSSGRINYTVVGDTVNTAERLEQLAREYMDEDEEVAVLASAATLQAVGSTSQAQQVGRHKLRGRREAMEVYKLL